MPDYPKLYRMMFNAQTDAIRLQEMATDILKRAQQDAEAIYMDSPDAVIRMLDTTKPIAPESIEGGENHEDTV